MKKVPLILTAVLVAVSVGACNQENMYASYKAEDTFADGKIQTQPNFAQFSELPVPERSTMDLKRTMLFGNNPLVGRLTYTAPYSQSNMFDFYMQEMPKFGWREVTVIRSANSVLTFSKDKRIATIQLTSTSMNNTDVILDISFASEALRNGY